MPNWNEILNEVKDAGSTYDIVRKKYLTNLHKLTGRNVITLSATYAVKIIENHPGVAYIPQTS
ncbi:MAG: hypothetical protein KAW12_24195 [Candidatus Aminicenantes bacterium]|nr:hypothetical protein [Candidatus Aminicenantes bacterium]